MVEEQKTQIRERVGVVLLAGVLLMSGLLLIKQEEVPVTFTEGSESYSSSEVEKSVLSSRTSSLPSNDNKATLVNINKASLEELDTLPGIGPATALKIIDYRTQNGIFASIEEIKEVSGIGEVKYSQLKDLISI